ncbi:MAG: DUF91 domain-containing protein [Chloroflexi bacterium]|nr:DUF91 domain-containing protein [Chloroflexota bacterium]
MSVEVAMWRIDEGVSPISFTGMDSEARLQEIIANDISIVDPTLMVIGREVTTPYGGRIDILAIDGDGRLSVIELKRNLTPREIVAQALDYGSWVRCMTIDEIAETFIRYQERFHQDSSPTGIDEALRERFSNVPDELNTAHRLVVVAADLDPSTERIVTYLQEEYGVEINVVFFRAFTDGERQYLTRAWLKEPEEVSGEMLSKTYRSVRNGEWNGEYYVSFGERVCRNWNDAKKYGFVSAGGGEWYVNTLRKLQPGNRIWVNIPGTGYVGVGVVTSEAKRFDQFNVTTSAGSVPLTSLSLEAPEAFNEEISEHYVGVNWIKAVEARNAVKERGFFGNQNTVALPTAPSWAFTVERLKSLWKVE